MSKFKKIVMLIAITAGIMAYMVGTIVGVCLSITEEANIETSSNLEPNN